MKPVGNEPSAGGGLPERAAARPAVGTSGRRRLGDLLLAAGAVSVAALEEGLAEQAASGGRLGRILVDRGLLAERTLLEVLGTQLRVGVVDLNTLTADPEATSRLSYELAKKYRCLPWKREERLLHVAMADPQDAERVQAVQFAAGMRLRVYLCSDREIDIGIEQHYGMEEAVDQIVRNITREARLAEGGQALVVEGEGVRGGEPARSGEGAGPETAVGATGERMAPIVRLVNLIVLEAVRKEASDIHFEPAQQHLRVRFRLDGVLHKRMHIPKYLQQAVLSRIKVMARMDIANKRTPQDGGIRLAADGRRLDLRVSSLPTLYGEKIVVRILDQTDRPSDLRALGCGESDRQRLADCYRRPQGMILVTGPTGSGKSTTLQCILRDLRTDGTNIVTVEDPIEYELEGINQVQVHREAGLTFADCLRAILRQDPDVIMVGEIRDRETAEVAFRAAQTGHMVLSTLHTNDTFSTVTRLADIGVPRFLVASALLAVVSQRLVRKVCKDCAVDEALEPSLRERLAGSALLLEGAALRKGRGCSNCDYTGYRGRIGIFELLVLSGEIRDAVASGESEDRIRRRARALGMKSLLEDGLQKALVGLTSLEEVLSTALWEPPELEGSRLLGPCAGSGRADNGDLGTSETPAPLIVLAEDDPAVREAVRMALRCLDCKVVEAADGLDAHNKISRLLPDVVILDIQMPGLDGYEVLRRIRSDLRTVFIPVVFLTARNRCEDRVKGFLMGGDDYIEKPFDHRELVARVKRQIEKTSALRQRAFAVSGGP